MFADLLIKLRYLPYDLINSLLPRIGTRIGLLVLVEEPVEVLLLALLPLPLLHGGDLDQALRLHPVVHRRLRLLHLVERGADY